MKKIILLLIITIFLSSCGEDSSNMEQTGNINNLECSEPYNLGSKSSINLKLKGVVVSDETKNVSSPISGVVTYLNCNAGKSVYSTTLIAKVSPDYNNPNIINLNIQKGSLVSQRSNIESLKSTTIMNFDNQIEDLKQQISITKSNIELTKKSGTLSKMDLEKQIESLRDSLASLQKNLELLESAKKEALEKIEISRKNIYTNIKNVSSDNLLKIDEIYGITEENKRLNDVYEKYLGTKDINLLNSIEENFRKLNAKNIDEMSDIEISEFLGDLVSLDEDIKKSIKSSIENVYLSKTQIDSFYLMFLNYSKSIADLKNSWDSIDNSKSSTITSFDTQISSLENQISTTKSSLENLETNKIGSIDTANELQLAGLDAQLKTLNTNLNNLIASKKSQVITLDNQILALNQSISSLNSSLSSRSIYAGISGIVKQKLTSQGNNVGAGMSLCQIIPNVKSTKIKIYSPLELELGDKLTFEFKGEKYEIIVENSLIYKDIITQNYVYESNYLDKKYFKEGEIISLKLEESENKSSDEENKNEDIIIPVSYVKNKIDGNYVKIKTATGVLEQMVELGDINGNNVEVKVGMDNAIEICK